MHGSTYLVYFHLIGLDSTRESIVGIRVESSTFLAVEDWADENTPEGYDLRSIEKHYGTTAELTTTAGEVDVDLRASVQA